MVTVGPAESAHLEGQPLNATADLTTDQVAAQVGVTRRQLDHWVRTGLIRGIDQAGSGRTWRWTPDLIDRASRLAQLVGLGFTPQAAAGHLDRGVDVRRVRATLTDPLGSLHGPISHLDAQRQL